MLISTALAAWLNLGTPPVAIAASPAPVVNYGAQMQSRNGAITVQPGDTVESIAKLYRLPVEDIIAYNHLEAPYALKTRQRLILPLPKDHKVGRNDTLYSLSRMYGVSPEHIAAVNHIDPPYTLHMGQMLRIPVTGATPPVKAVAEAEPAIKAAAKADAKQKQISADVKKPPQVAASEAQMLKTPGPSPEHKAFNSLLTKISGDEKSKSDAPHARTAETSSMLTPFAEQPDEKVTYVALSKRSDFIWPVRGQVISSYGPKAGGLYNDGINIAAPRGTPVKAAADGVVAYVGDKLHSYGNLVLIRHPGGMITAYAHLNAVTVREGMPVKRGQAIGSVGSTGTVANAQLHFEVRKGADTLDPKNYLG